MRGRAGRSQQRWSLNPQRRRRPAATADAPAVREHDFEHRHVPEAVPREPLGAARAEREARAFRRAREPREQRVVGRRL